jgi:hypothetical protein
MTFTKDQDELEVVMRLIHLFFSANEFRLCFVLCPLGKECLDKSSNLHKPLSD